MRTRSQRKTHLNNAWERDWKRSRQLCVFVISRNISEVFKQLSMLRVVEVHMHSPALKSLLARSTDASMTPLPSLERILFENGRANVLGSKCEMTSGPMVCDEEVVDSVLPIYMQPPPTLSLLEDGYEVARRGDVPCRIYRTSFTNCVNDEEFLAKLYCVRQALACVSQCCVCLLRRMTLCTGDFGCGTTAVDCRQWWSTGRFTTTTGKRQRRDEWYTSLLCACEKEMIAGFHDSYSSLMGYVQQNGSLAKIASELATRRVAVVRLHWKWTFSEGLQVNFYDVVLDYTLMDAFDDLEKPPSAIVAVARNRLLSATMKKAVKENRGGTLLQLFLPQALRTVIWTALKMKRSVMSVSDGFKSRFYDVTEQVRSFVMQEELFGINTASIVQVLPALAWGFLGDDKELRELCFYVKVRRVVVRG